MKLNLGCGPDYRDGYVNVDIDDAVKADVRLSIADLTPETLGLFGYREPIEHIFLKHVLEHFPIDVVPELLVRWHGWLAPGGTILIDGPNLRTMAAHIARKTFWTREDVAMIYGGQLTKGDFHQTGWDPPMLANMLFQAGFRDIQRQDVDLCFVMQGRKPA